MQMGEQPPPAAKVYYDGCPGCAMDSKKDSRQGVPYKELLFVGATTFASGRFFQFCSCSCARVIVHATNVSADAAVC